jgi:hypothetical protein
MNTSECWEWCHRVKAFTIVGGHDGGGLWASTSLLGASWEGTLLSSRGALRVKTSSTWTCDDGAWAS